MMQQGQYNTDIFIALLIITSKHNVYKTITSFPHETGRNHFYLIKCCFISLVPSRYVVFIMMINEIQNMLTFLNITS